MNVLVDDSFWKFTLSKNKKTRKPHYFSALSLKSFKYRTVGILDVVYKKKRKKHKQNNPCFLCSHKYMRMVNRAYLYMNRYGDLIQIRGSNMNSDLLSGLSIAAFLSSHSSFLIIHMTAWLRIIQKY